jgi:hypothetical protein
MWIGLVVALSAGTGTVTDLQFHSDSSSTRIVLSASAPIPPFAIRRPDPRTLFVDVAVDVDRWTGSHESGAPEVLSLVLGPRDWEDGRAGLRVALRLVAPVPLRVEPLGREVRITVGRSRPPALRSGTTPEPPGPADSDRLLRLSPAPAWRTLELPCDEVYLFHSPLGDGRRVRIEPNEGEAGAGIPVFDGIPMPGDVLLVPCRGRKSHALRYQTAGEGEGLFYLLRPAQGEPLAKPKVSPFVGRWECTAAAQPGRPLVHLVLLPDGKASGTRSVDDGTPATLGCSGVWTDSGEEARIEGTCRAQGSPGPPVPGEMRLRLESANLATSEHLSCRLTGPAPR